MGSLKAWVMCMLSKEMGGPWCPPLSLPSHDVSKLPLPYTPSMMYSITQVLEAKWSSSYGLKPPKSEAK